MKNSFQFLFGMDFYTIHLPLVHFLNQSRLSKIHVFECKSTNDGLEFYAPVYQRKQIDHTFKHRKRIKTVGCVGFIIRQFKQPFRVFLMLWCIFLYQLLSHCVLDISYQSTNQALTNNIENHLNKLGYTTPFFAWSNAFSEELKESIKQEFQTEIAWIEVTRSASKIQISFNDKQYGTTKEYNSTPLIATKSGMIVRFDITHGEKKVEINQIVNEGDVLVDNVLLDSNNVEKNVYVEGHVWAKTWTTVESSIEMSTNLKILEPFHFTRLLMQCRAQIEKELSANEEIIKESVLQFDRIGSKIIMKVHYTCLEDITIS